MLIAKKFTISAYQGSVAFAENKCSSGKVRAIEVHRPHDPNGSNGLQHCSLFSREVSIVLTLVLPPSLSSNNAELHDQNK